MAYATVEQLASALRIAVTTKNEADLQRCVDAAAEEIDHDLDRFASVQPLDPVPELLVTVNIGRGAELFKLADALFGGVGFADIGVLRVQSDGFERWSAMLIPFHQQFGIA